MDSTASRALVKQEEKKQESPLNRLPRVLKREIISWLVDDKTGKFKSSNFPAGTFFFNLSVSYAIKAITDLVHRRDVPKTLAWIKKYPDMLLIPFSIEIKDPHGQRIRRKPMQILAAVDEFDPIEMKAETKPHGLVPVLLSMFNNPDDPQSCHITEQLQIQLQEQMTPAHELATKQRNARYLKEIENFIDAVIACLDISNNSNDIPFKNLFDLELVQDFIKNAFKPDPNDDGSLGSVWDYWQLSLDYYIVLLTSKVSNLGGLRSRKTDLVDNVIYMALMGRSQFCHLEFCAKGIENIADGKLPADYFDCSKGCPVVLAGIGTTDFFSLYGTKLARGGWADITGVRYRIQNFCRTKKSVLHSLCGQKSAVRAVAR